MTNSTKRRREEWTFTKIACMVAAAALLAIAMSAPAAAQGKKPNFPSADPQEMLKTFASEFVEITPGEGKFPKSFTMGGTDPSEKPRHEVALGYSFSMAKYEVPQNLYESVMKSNPSVWGGPRNSVEMMTWREAVDFCKRATTAMRAAKLIADDEEIRLPTESEWEYCCRGGAATAYSFGDKATRDGDEGNKASALDEFGWHTGNAAGNDPPVGAKKPNAFGLYDMHGYLWEYVADTWHGSYDGAPADGSSWDEKGHSPPRIIRGGSWRDRHESLQSATRWSVPDHIRSDAIGFRCVRAKVRE